MNRIVDLRTGLRSFGLRLKDIFMELPVRSFVAPFDSLNLEHLLTKLSLLQPHFGTQLDARFKLLS